MLDLLIGIIQIALGSYVIHWAQGLLDYVVAFPVVGLAGIFRKQILEAAKNLDKKSPKPDDAPVINIFFIKVN
jgi:thiamine transporter